MIALTEHQQALKPRLEGANINATSFLATDYLNHFNEVVMLLEMAADMPEMLEDAAEWQPKSYSEHFADSGFAQADLAIEAYDHCPATYRTPFDAQVDELNLLVLCTLEEAQAAQADASLDGSYTAGLIGARIETMRAALARLNGIIHGKAGDPAATSADGTAAPAPQQPEGEGELDQDAIDALFD